MLNKYLVILSAKVSKVCKARPPRHVPFNFVQYFTFLYLLYYVDLVKVNCEGALLGSRLSQELDHGLDPPLRKWVNNRNESWRSSSSDSPETRYFMSRRFSFLAPSPSPPR